MTRLCISATYGVLFSNFFSSEVIFQPIELIGKECRSEGFMKWALFWALALGEFAGGGFALSFARQFMSGAGKGGWAQTVKMTALACVLLLAFALLILSRQPEFYTSWLKQPTWGEPLAHQIWLDLRLGGRRGGWGPSLAPRLQII